MNNDLVIEPISAKWIENLRDAVHAVAVSGRFLRTTEGFSLEQTREFVNAILCGAGVQFIARERKRVVGWCDIVRLPFDGMRHGGALGIGVLEDYRRRGIGSALLEAAIGAAADGGISRIELEVFAQNEAAIALYRLNGFEIEGVKRRARIIDGDADDIVCMALLNYDVANTQEEIE